MFLLLQQDLLLFRYFGFEFTHFLLFSRDVLFGKIVHVPRLFALDKQVFNLPLVLEHLGLCTFVLKDHFVFLIR